ncbi:MAG: GDSL-type esterase/lipase family protein [Kiritimatiellae bacterium]|nr:GDSL-type esterase/lipase family protein [Kiritimatiellia bacterium]MDD5521764.1 GDSL-type esterase/lipase family protein [Kiritimatiellia bacterium]
MRIFIPNSKVRSFVVRQCIVCLAVLQITLSGMAAEITTNGLTVHNKGIGGNNTEQGRKRFEQHVVAIKPDYVFIYFGLNDALNEKCFVSLERFVENLTWMVDHARTNGIKPVLCTIHSVTEEPLFKRHKRELYGSEGPNGKVARYNTAILSLAQTKKVPLADFAKAAGQPGTVSADGVHLTSSGYKLLAKTFFDVVAPELKGNEVIVCLGDSITYSSGMKGVGTAEGETYPAFLRQIQIPPHKNSP